MSKKLLLFPFGGNARESLMSVFAINAGREEWDILGFIDDDRSSHGKHCCGIKVLGGREVLNEFPDAFVLAVPGSPASYLRRKDIIGGLGIDKTRFATIIHPSVQIAPDSIVGYNTLIMPNVVITCGVRIGNHCIFLPNTVVSHDSKSMIIAASDPIFPFPDPSGSVRAVTSVRERRCGRMSPLARGTLVGLGSNVISNIEAGVIAVGSPAKVIRKIIS